MSRPRTRAVSCLPVACLALLISGCGGADASARAAAAGGLRVVAVENVWGDLVRQIGGPRVRVTSILRDPNADPHSYETNPRTAAAVSDAAFVVENGLGYDAFADKLLSVGGSKHRSVLSVADAVGVHGPDANPHLWYSPDYVRAAAGAIAGRLTDLEPASAPDFQAGLRRFLAGYQTYADALAAIRVRYSGTAVSYTERVPGYLLQAAGLRLGTPASFALAVEDGSDPSPADVDAMHRAMAGRTVAVLLYNAQVTSPVTAEVRRLAQADGVPVVGVAETIPADEPDLQTWQTDQAKAVLAALGG